MFDKILCSVSFFFDVIVIFTPIRKSKCLRSQLFVDFKVQNGKKLQAGSKKTCFSTERVFYICGFKIIKNMISHLPQKTWKTLFIASCCRHDNKNLGKGAGVKWPLVTLEKRV